MIVTNRRLSHEVRRVVTSRTIALRGSTYFCKAYKLQAVLDPHLLSTYPGCASHFSPSSRPNLGPGSFLALLVLLTFIPRWERTETEMKVEKKRKDVRENSDLSFYIVDKAAWRG